MTKPLQAPGVHNPGYVWGIELRELLHGHEQHSMRNNVVPLDEDYGYPRKNY